MSIISTIKGWFTMLLKSRAKDEFNITPITSSEMAAWVDECARIYQGNPCWLDEDDHVDTINFAKSICSEVARLTTMGIGITVDGSARADWIQQQIEKIYYQLRDWVEYGCAYGTIILKPNGDSVDLYTPGNYEVTHQTNGVIDGVVFMDEEQQGEKWYTRLEYHRFLDNGLYAISNKCYVGDSRGDAKKSIDIKQTPWYELAEEATIENADRTLFGVFKTPQANNIDTNSPCGLPVFSEAIQELRDLDIAYSRNSKEIKDSKRTVLLDSDTMVQSGKPVGHRPEIKLPDYVKNVYGDGQKMFYQEINPTLNTDERLTGINALLSQIGFKVGFSNGYFVFNEKTGMVTATQVESDDRRTIQFIKDVRDKLESCLSGLIYALNVFADLYDFAPVGDYEITFDFGDITYSFELDKQTWYKYAVAGYIPFWYYLVKFEGFSEDEAKAMVQEATPKVSTLFGE